MKILRTHKNLSFGTSPDNDFGLRLNLKFDEDTKTAYSSEISIPAHFQGHKANHVHPGILAVMLDEVMMYISHSLEMQVETGELTIRYLQPARTGSDLHIRGYFVKKIREWLKIGLRLKMTLARLWPELKANTRKLTLWNKPKWRNW